MRKGHSMPTSVFGIAQVTLGQVLPDTSLVREFFLWVDEAREGGKYESSEDPERDAFMLLWARMRKDGIGKVTLFFFIKSMF